MRASLSWLHCVCVCANRTKVMLTKSLVKQVNKPNRPPPPVSNPTHQTHIHIHTHTAAVRWSSLGWKRRWGSGQRGRGGGRELCATIGRGAQACEGRVRGGGGWPPCAWAAATAAHTPLEQPWRLPLPQRWGPLA